ncbi:major facilitator superfamily domain-containing protein [Syncephalis plumigaleata]|nr:major facilitator superfamily domain-containing protein [Syncephalis plumigaleata]
MVLHKIKGEEADTTRNRHVRGDTTVVSNVAATQEEKDKSFINTNNEEDAEPLAGLCHQAGEIVEVDETDQLPVSWYVLFISTLAAIGGFLFGYDTGVISGAMLFIEEEFHLSVLQVELIVGATTLGAIFGGFSAGFLSDRFGRRPVTILSSIVFLLGALLMAFAPGYEVLLVGRFVVGIGVGLASMVVPTYISEVSPRQYRGQLVTMNVLMITGGQLVAYCVSAGLGNVTNGWRIMLGIAGVPPIIQLIGMPFLPESPRYLLRRKRGSRADNTAAARRMLTRVYASTPVSLPACLRLRRSSNNADNNNNGGHVANTANEMKFKEQVSRQVEDELLAIEHAATLTAGTTYADLLRPQYRRSLLVACGLQAFQQLSGFNTAMYYSASILRMSGFRDKQSAVTFSILVVATNMFMTLVAIRYVDRVGRRRILLYTIMAMALGLLLMGMAFAFLLGLRPYQADCSSYVHCGSCVADNRCAYVATLDRCMPQSQVLLPDMLSQNGNPGNLPLGSLQCENSAAWSWFALAALIFYVASYALGLGNVPWLIQSELFPLALRGRAGGVATSVNWLGNLIVSVSFLSLTHAITAAGTFWLYASLGVLAWWFVWRYVPETAGRTLEELGGADADMNQRQGMVHKA